MLESIQKFYQELYEMLDKHPDIRKLVRVHATVQKDATSWLLINLLEAAPQTIGDKSACQLSFEICVFTQEASHKTSLTAANLIRQVLEPQNFAVSQYQIISIKDQKLTWTRSQDLRTIKLCVLYKVFMRQL